MIAFESECLMKHSKTFCFSWSVSLRTSLRRNRIQVKEETRRQPHARSMRNSSFSVINKNKVRKFYARLAHDDNDNEYNNVFSVLVRFNSSSSLRKAFVHENLADVDDNDLERERWKIRGRKLASRMRGTRHRRRQQFIPSGNETLNAICIKRIILCRRPSDERRGESPNRWDSLGEV